MPLILRAVSLLGINSTEVPGCSWRPELWEKLAGDWKLNDITGLIVRKVISLAEVPRIDLADERRPLF